MKTQRPAWQFLLQQLNPMLAIPRASVPHDAGRAAALRHTCLLLDRGATIFEEGSVANCARRRRSAKGKAPQINAGLPDREHPRGALGPRLNVPKAMARGDRAFEFGGGFIVTWPPMSLHHASPWRRAYNRCPPHRRWRAAAGTCVRSAVNLRCVAWRRKRASTAGQSIARPSESGWCERILIGRAFAHRPLLPRRCDWRGRTAGLLCATSMRMADRAARSVLY